VVNGTIRGWGDAQFSTFPFNSRDADLGIGVFFQLDTDFADQLLESGRGFVGRSVGCSGLILEPIFVAGLVAVQPFEEPGLSSA
jgi:hypothetical protein